MSGKAIAHHFLGVTFITLIMSLITPAARAQKIEYLLRQADLIVRGEVESIKSDMSNLEDPLELVTIRVSDVIAGATGDRLTITNHPHSSRFASPHFVPGEEVIVILN